MALLRGWKKRLAAPIVALSVWGTALAQTANEYDVKAACLYNFTRFVEWPAPSDSSPFCIGVAGGDPFHGALDRVVNGRSASGRGIAVRRFKSGDAPASCEMVFIAGSDLGKARTVLASIHGPAVLTVGEAAGFSKRGGVIEFSLEENKVKLTINLDAAQRAHLQVSSKLLSLASVVRDSD
jgi:hypothetical protein